MRDRAKRWGGTFTAFAVIRLAAAAGAFLLLCSLAEATSVRRIGIELALIAPYAVTALASAILRCARDHRSRHLVAWDRTRQPHPLRTADNR